MPVRIVGANRGCVVLRPDLRVNGFKVFSATMYKQRDQLGETVTAWLASHVDLTIIDITVIQSSDAAFHCVTFVIGYRQPS